MYIKRELGRIASENCVKATKHLAARWCCSAALAAGVAIPGVVTAGCSSVPTDKPGETTARSVAAIEPAVAYDITFRLTSIWPGSTADAAGNYVQTGTMVTKLDGVPFPPNVYNYFFTCGGGSSGGSASCSPYDQPHYYPDPTQPADAAHCPAVIYPPGGGLCINYAGLTDYPVGWLRHYANYTPTGSTTVPLSVTFNSMDSWLGMTGGANPKITLNLDLTTGTVMPVAPYDLVIHDIVNNCVIFNPDWYSTPTKICYAVEVKPIYAVEVPYHIQSLLYVPPFNQSSASYGSESTIGTKETWTWTDSSTSTSGNSFEFEGTSITHGGFTTVESTIGGKSVISQSSGSKIFTAYREDQPCNDAGCDFSGDPNHDFDTFYLQLRMTGTQMAGGDKVLDVSSGTAIHLSVGDLKLIVQGNYDEVDPLIKSLVQECIKPSDAQQILDADPYVSGMDIEQHPERFEPACQTPGPCLVPDHELIQWLRPTETATSVELAHVYGTGNEQISGTSTGLEIEQFLFNSGVGVKDTYEDITTISDFASHSAAVTLKNTSRCESGTVDLWFDKAFGTLLWVTNIQNRCAEQPTRSESFETPSDWQIQGGTATLSDNAISGAHSLAITANGSVQLASTSLSSAVLRGAATSGDLSKVSFALNIPTQQPNPLAIGTAQMYISSPTANVNNVGMGEVQLTGLPQGQFVRLGFTIPDAALPALTQDNPDVTFTLVLNVAAGTSGWLVDDLQIGCSTCGACTSTCAQGTVCTSGAECGSLVCTIDADHIPNGICQAPACAPQCLLGTGCGANGDCASQVCGAGVCQPPVCSPTCAEGNVCGSNGDCASGVCTNGVCAPPACSPTCPQGTACASNSECGSRVCTSGTCQAPACAPRCHLGAGCGADTDCGSKVCIAGVCQAPTCSPTCPETAACDANTDCQAHICTNNVCVAPSCSPNCAAGVACGANSECGSKICNNGVCAPPACSPSCSLGASCGAAGDCTSRSCTGGQCRPSCSPHCNQSTPCVVNGDCGSQVCSGGLCRAPACSPLCPPAAACGLNADCASLVCTNNLCRAPSCSPHCNDGAACGVNGDCNSRVCSGGLCRAPACAPHCGTGAACGVNAECTSKVCNNGICR